MIRKLPHGTLPTIGATADYQTRFARHSSSPLPLEPSEPVSGWASLLVADVACLVALSALVAFLWLTASLLADPAPATTCATTALHWLECAH